MKPVLEQLEEKRAAARLGGGEKRIAAQWPVERKMDRADFVVWTEGPLEVTEEQLIRIFN
jgi:dephospho-CoA kinase